LLVSSSGLTSQLIFWKLSRIISLHGEKMASPFLSTLFTTLAQVSFTVSGLMAVAIAGDSKRRDYWFGHEARSLFVYISFLLLLLPGFVSIGGLIPPSIKTTIPSWPFTTFVLGVLYSTLAVVFFFRKRKLAEPEEFKRLEQRFSKVNSEMGLFGFAMIFVSVGGYSGYYTASNLTYSQAETLVGIILFIAMMSGAVASVVLLRVNDEISNKVIKQTEITRLPDPSSVVESQGSNSNTYLFTTLSIAAIAFLVGLLIKIRDN